MKSETGESRSVWMAMADVPAQRPLDASTEADTCVIGAGIAGLSVAYFLAKAGKKVVVLDDGPIASGQTRRTTAHLANALDDRYYEIIRERGEEAAKLAADSHTAAIEAIAKIVADEAIDCDFSRVDGYLVLGGDSTEEDLDKELEATRKAGLTRVEKVAEARDRHGASPRVSRSGSPRRGSSTSSGTSRGSSAPSRSWGGRSASTRTSRRSSRAHPRRSIRRAGRSSRRRRSSSRRIRRSTTWSRCTPSRRPT